MYKRQELDDLIVRGLFVQQRQRIGHGLLHGHDSLCFAVSLENCRLLFGFCLEDGGLLFRVCLQNRGFLFALGDKDLAVGIGVEQFLGFPSNVVICREVGDAVGETPEEKAFIEDTLNVPYVVGGITVITVLSTMLAGFVINML